jgi:two-component system sensor histidine kinase KdpD
MGFMSERRPRGAPPAWRVLSECAFGLAIIALSCVTARLLPPGFVLADIVMIFLLGVAFVSTRIRLAAAIFTAVLSVLAFEYFFLPPLYSFAVVNPKHLVTFMVMLFVAVTISGLTERLRHEKVDAQQRERRSAALYLVSRELAEGHEIGEFASIAARHIHEVFDCRVVVLLPGPKEGLVQAPTGNVAFDLDAVEMEAARAAINVGRPTGIGTPEGARARGMYLPLSTSRGIIGVLGVLADGRPRLDDPDEVRLLEAFASLLASAVERAELRQAADSAKLEVETERLRSALLSSVSHDLRTPLAAITGAASTLLDDDATLAPPMRTDLLQTMFEEADRLNRWVKNLLDMTRLESGGVHLRREWQPVEEVVGAALNRMEAQLEGRPVETVMPADVTMALFDGVLIEQVLVNLLENAVKYTPPATSISVKVQRQDALLLFEVADRGPGVPKGEEQRIFDKFYRAHRAQGGVGLGLAICRAIVVTHGGVIWVEDRPRGGAAFRFTLPLDERPPDFGSFSQPRLTE